MAARQRPAVPVLLFPVLEQRPAAVLQQTYYGQLYILISELPSIFLIVAENRSPRNHASRKTSARFLCFLAFSSRSWYNIAIQILSGRAAFRA